jgi:hypothetical protein
MVDGIGSVVATFDIESDERIQDLKGFCGRDYDGVREPDCVDYPDTPCAAAGGVLVSKKIAIEIEIQGAPVS